MIKKSAPIMGKEIDNFDFAPDNYGDYDGFVSEKYISDPISTYYESGVISPVDEVEEDSQDIFLVSDEIPDDIDGLMILSSQEYPGPNVIDRDIRYSNIIKNADKIFVDKKYANLIDYKNILENFAQNTPSNSEIYLKSDNLNFKITRIADNLNLNSETMSKDGKEILKISKKFSQKKLVKISNGEKVFAFNCDVADTEELKRIGLQNRDYLKANHGMIFEYKKPESVMFHMGTVKFPIDIVFADEDNNVKKIVANIKPNSLGVYSCSDVKNVVELPGGYCSRLNIKEGSMIHIDKENSSFNIVSQDFSKVALAINLDSVIKDVSYEKMIKLSSLNIANHNQRLDSSGFNVSFNKSPLSDINNPNFDKIIFYHSNLGTNDNYNLILKNVLSKSGYYKNNYDIIRVSSTDKKQIHKAVYNKFNIDKLYFANSFEKTANFNVEPDVKKVAKDVIAIYEKVLDMFLKMKKDLEKNKKAFEKIKDNFNVIKKTKGQYKQSVKRLAKKYKNILLNIKKSIKLLNSIKDVSAVDDINGALILSLKNASDKTRLVFEMVDYMDSLEFYQDFEKKTNDAVAIYEDCERNCKRIREFCYADILGKTIISE